MAGELREKTELAISLSYIKTFLRQFSLSKIGPGIQDHSYATAAIDEEMIENENDSSPLKRFYNMENFFTSFPESIDDSPRIDEAVTQMYAREEFAFGKANDELTGLMIVISDEEAAPIVKNIVPNPLTNVLTDGIENGVFNVTGKVSSRDKEVVILQMINREFNMENKLLRRLNKQLKLKLKRLENSNAKCKTMLKKVCSILDS